MLRTRLELSFSSFFSSLFGLLFGTPLGETSRSLRADFTLDSAGFVCFQNRIFVGNNPGSQLSVITSDFSYSLHHHSCLLFLTATLDRRPTERIQDSFRMFHNKGECLIFSSLGILRGHSITASIHHRRTNRVSAFSISHGVTMTATKKEKIIAAEALAGIGLI